MPISQIRSRGRDSFELGIVAIVHDLNEVPSIFVKVTNFSPKCFLFLGQESEGFSRQVGLRLSCRFLMILPQLVTGVFNIAFEKPDFCRIHDCVRHLLSRQDATTQSRSVSLFGGQLHNMRQIRMSIESPVNPSPTRNSALLISVSDVAEILGISERTIWRLVSAGTFFEPLRIGRCAKWRRNEIENWVESGCPKITK